MAISWTRYMDQQLAAQPHPRPRATGTEAFRRPSVSPRDVPLRAASRVISGTAAGLVGSRGPRLTSVGRLFTQRNRPAVPSMRSALVALERVHQRVTQT